MARPDWVGDFQLGSKVFKEAFGQRGEKCNGPEKMLSPKIGCQRYLGRNVSEAQLR